MVMRAVTSGSATRKDGSSSVTGVSQAMRPSSTIWAMSRVVMVLVVETIIIRGSGVTGDGTIYAAAGSWTGTSERYSCDGWHADPWLIVSKDHGRTWTPPQRVPVKPLDWAYPFGHILELAEGRLASRMPVEQLHFASNGYLHAASVVALADTSCGYATVAHLPAGAQSFTTIELKSNHLGTVKEGAIACVATAQHLGRNTQVWDAVVTDEASGRTIALFRCTQMVLWPKG